VLLESPGPGGDPCGSFSDIVAKHAPSTMTTTDALKDVMGKVKCVPVEVQPTYTAFFQYANEHMQGRIVLLSNTDVAFDSTLSLVRRGILAAGRIGFVLSVQSPPHRGQYREVFGSECDVPNRCLYKSGMFGDGMSFDAYIFHSPLLGRKKVDWRHIDHVMNLYGAENRAAFELEVHAGVNLSNPCRHVHAFHWHCKGGKMHGERRITIRGNRENLGKVVPCWDCPGLRTEEGWPECRAGIVKNASMLLGVKFPSAVQVCLRKKAKIRRLTSRLQVCKSPHAVNCIMPRGERVPHEVY